MNMFCTTRLDYCNSLKLKIKAPQKLQLLQSAAACLISRDGAANTQRRCCASSAGILFALAANCGLTPCIRSSEYQYGCCLSTDCHTSFMSPVQCCWLCAEWNSLFHCPLTWAILAKDLFLNLGGSYQKKVSSQTASCSFEGTLLQWQESHLKMCMSERKDTETCEQRRVHPGEVCELPVLKLPF